jgi:hypothetical protein
MGKLVRQLIPLTHKLGVFLGRRRQPMIPNQRRQSGPNAFSVEQIEDLPARTGSGIRARRKILRRRED